MVVGDSQFMALLKGRRVKLTLKSSSFVGVLQRINPNKTLVLADVTGSNGCKYPGTLMFFGHEILNVEFTNKENEGRSEDNFQMEKLPYKAAFTFGDDEYEENFVNFVVVDEFHEKFGQAVMHIKKQKVIGVGAEGVEILRNGRLCWLQFATKADVYLFDILLLGMRAFKNGLSMILESKHILKVMHDCRAVAGSLLAQFGVKLANVFDTQVADVLCFYSETGGFLPDRVSTLQEVVSLHLKVSSSRLSSLKAKSHITEEESEMWYQRPCPVSLLKAMASSVTHLLPLRLMLLDTLMTDYMSLVDSYLTSSLCVPDGLDHVTLKNVLELPKELRQLEAFRRERREWARRCYPVTEQGLVARFNPLPQPDSQDASAAEDHFTAPPELVTSEPFAAPQTESTVTQQSKCTPSSVPQPEIPVLATMPNPGKGLWTNPLQSAGLDKGDTQSDAVGAEVLTRKQHLMAPQLLCFGRGFSVQPPRPSPPGDREASSHTLAKAVAND